MPHQPEREYPWYLHPNGAGKKSGLPTRFHHHRCHVCNSVLKTFARKQGCEKDSFVSAQNCYNCMFNVSWKLATLDNKSLHEEYARMCDNYNKKLERRLAKSLRPRVQHEPACHNNSHLVQSQEQVDIPEDYQDERMAGAQVGVDNALEGALALSRSLVEIEDIGEGEWVDTRQLHRILLRRIAALEEENTGA
ncbi:hypothetical protein FPOAC2_06946 [Fusarium poae]|jgi:hypothetical protein